MKLEIYCYRDKVLGYGAPIVYQNEPDAVRNFSYEVNKNRPFMNFIPEDFELYKLGDYDTESGQLITIAPKFIVNGVTVRKNDENNK